MDEPPSSKTLPGAWNAEFNDDYLAPTASHLDKVASAQEWHPKLFHKSQASSAYVKKDDFIDIKNSELKASMIPPSSRLAASIKGEVKGLVDGIPREVAILFLSRITGTTANCAHFTKTDRAMFLRTLNLFIGELDPAFDPRSLEGNREEGEKAGKVGTISRIACFERSGDSRPSSDSPNYTRTPYGTVVAKKWPMVSVENCPEHGGFFAQRMTTMGNNKLNEERKENDPLARDSIDMIRDDSSAGPIEGFIRIIDEGPDEGSRDWENSTLTSVTQFVKYDAPSLVLTSARIHLDDIGSMCQARTKATERYCDKLADSRHNAASSASDHVSRDWGKKRKYEQGYDHRNEQNQPKRARMHGTASARELRYQGSEQGNSPRLGAAPNDRDSKNEPTDLQQHVRTVPFKSYSDRKSIKTGHSPRFTDPAAPTATTTTDSIGQPTVGNSTVQDSTVRNDANGNSGHWTRNYGPQTTQGMEFSQQVSRGNRGTSNSNADHISGPSRGQGRESKHKGKGGGGGRDRRPQKQ